MKEEKGKGGQLSEELKRLRRRVAELEQAETERERAEEALRESQEHAQFLADMLERSSQPFAVGYPDGQLMTYNTAYCKLLGYSKEELHELQWLTDLTPPEWREVVAKAAEEMGRTGQPQHFEKEYIRKDGSRVPVEVFAHPIFDSKGNIQYFYSFFTDITERKRIEHNLKESENKFRGIAERSFDLIFTTDKGGYLTYVSPAAEKIFYFKPEEMVGKHFKNFLVESEIPRVFQRFSENLEGKNLGVFSMEAIRKDGSHIFAELNSSPILENGETVGMQGAIRDITERKQAEEALRESEEKFRLLAENTQDIICLHHPDGRYIYVSPSCKKTLGYEAKELIGKDPYELVHPEDIEGIQKESYERVLKGEDILISYRIRKKSGEYIWFESTNQIIKNEKGNIAQIISVSRDITERKRAEEVLRQKTEQQEVLLSSIPAFVYFKDTELKLITANRAFAEMVNTPVDQLPGKDAYDLFPKEQAEKFHSDDKKVMESGKPMMNIEEKFTDAEGKTGWASTSKVPYFDERGEVVGMVGITIDITERKRAEDKVRKAREYAENIIATVREPLLVLDSGLRVISASRSFYEAFKVIPEETEEQFLYDLGNRQWDIPKLRELLEEILRKNTTVENYEMEHNFETIGQRTMLLNARKVREEEELILLAIEDVTERKKAEEALKDSEERYRGLFENSSEFLFILDLRGNFTNVNKAAVKLTGHTKAELLKMNFKDYTPRNNHRNLFRAFYNVFKTGKPLKDFSVTAIIEDKTVKYFEISVSPLKKGDEIIGFQGTSKDITERKRAEEELRQSLERLQKTLEGTVHALASAVEMRDPYTAGHQRRVTELACAVAEEMGLSEEQIEGLRMAGLIHDIGKINVPAEILSKPTHLTDIEFDLMKIHPQTGYDILKGIEFPWSVAQIVLQHHERLDGSGYPTGLKGDEILLEPRILGVADVVEAVSSHRPYRPARGLEKALEEIAQNKGASFTIPKW